MQFYFPYTCTSFADLISIILCVYNIKLGHDCRRVRSRRRHDATRLRCRQICSDSSRLSPTSCKLCTHRRHNSTRQLSRVGVGGVYWTKRRLKSNEHNRVVPGSRLTWRAVAAAVAPSASASFAPNLLLQLRIWAQNLHSLTPFKSHKDSSTSCDPADCFPSPRRLSSPSFVVVLSFCSFFFNFFFFFFFFLEPLTRFSLSSLAATLLVSAFAAYERLESKLVDCVFMARCCAVLRESTTIAGAGGKVSSSWMFSVNAELSGETVADSSARPESTRSNDNEFRSSRRVDESLRVRRLRSLFKSRDVRVSTTPTMTLSGLHIRRRRRQPRSKESTQTDRQTDRHKQTFLFTRRQTNVIMQLVRS